MTAAQSSEAALDWVRRIADPAFSAWDEHLAWLEADPANAGAFETASLLMDHATMLLKEAPLPVFAPVNDNDANPPPSHRRIGWMMTGGAALAASLLGVIAYRPVTSAGSFYLVSTRAGETREIALADGSRIALNGSTMLQLDRADPRSIELRQGEAFFTVAHGARRFSVAVGDAVVQDVGTEFGIMHEGGITTVAVRSGTVVYDPDREAVRLDGGQAIRVYHQQARVSRIDPAAAGGWRAGRLIYRDAPLGMVASDLSRSLGLAIKAGPAVSDRRFTGVIALGRPRSYSLRSIGDVLGVELRRDGDMWRMDAPAR